MKISALKASTGLLGYMEQGQQVTKDNVYTLPPGSVVRLKDGGRLIHLHKGLWLWCCNNAWCYDRVDNLAWHLPGELCHMPTYEEYST